MYMHPVITSQLAAEKRREMLAQAKHDRQAWQLASLARAERRADRARRQLRKAARLTLRVRSELSH
jgi:hypothetical protein